MEKGSGDSEVVINAGKRKRVSHGEKISKAKALAATRIADAVTVMAETYRSRHVDVPGASMGEVVAELQTLDDVANDPEWHAKCCQLMMLKPAREMFVALRGSEEKRLIWLRNATNNSSQVKFVIG